MIRKPNEFNPGKKYRVLVYGIPGLGKSTLALSAPKPLLVDADRGFERIDPEYRNADRITPTSYQEILDDLTVENVAEYETIVIDTGGALFDYMTQWIVKKNAKHGNGSGGLSLQGYGVAGYEFKRLCEYIGTALNKHLVIVFHAKEDKEGEVAKWRIDVPGATKNEAWKPMDLAGFMEVANKKRTISFSALDERYLAKGNRTVNEVYEIPELGRGRHNTFLADIFKRLDDGEKAMAGEIDRYTKLMSEVDGILSEVDDAETATKALERFKSLDHVFASKDESWSKLTLKAIALKLKFDRVSGTFKAE